MTQKTHPKIGLQKFHKHIFTLSLLFPSIFIFIFSVLLPISSLFIMFFLYRSAPIHISFKICVLVVKSFKFFFHFLSLFFPTNITMHKSHQIFRFTSYPFSLSTTYTASICCCKFVFFFFCHVYDILTAISKFIANKLVSNIYLHMYVFILIGICIYKGFVFHY